MMELGVLSSNAHWSAVRIRAMAVSWEFHTFMVLGASASVLNLEYGARALMVDHSNVLKAWHSTLVHPANVVLLVSNFICCFNILFFLSTKPAAFGFYGRWMSCSFAQSYISWPLKCDPQSLSIQRGQPYMVLSQMQWPHKRRPFLELSLRGKRPI